MELAQVLQKRRTYRAFLERPVERADIEKLMDAARQAPVSCNLQLTQFVVIDDEKKRKILEERVSYKFAYAPATIVVLYDPRLTVEHASAIMTAGMMSENILLKAVELGLATCPMAGFKKDETIKKLLHIPSHLELLLLIAVGYPVPETPYPIAKLPLGEIYRYNSYDGLEREVLNDSTDVRKHTPASVMQYRSRIAPTYLDRFRLRTYDERYYHDAFAAFEKEVLATGATSVLDVMSYDGCFIKMLREKNPDIAVTASDYVQNNLTFYAEKLGVYTASISVQNELKTNIHDAASFVFQADFTPEVGKLIRSSVDCIAKGGLFFVATIEDSWYRRLRERMCGWMRRIQGEPVNIYEGNPFYRIGPRTPVSFAKIEAAMHAAGCEKVVRGVAASYPTRGVKVCYFVFRKKG